MRCCHRRRAGDGRTAGVPGPPPSPVGVAAAAVDASDHTTRPIVAMRRRVRGSHRNAECGVMIRSQAIDLPRRPPTAASGFAYLRDDSHATKHAAGRCLSFAADTSFSEPNRPRGAVDTDNDAVDRGPRACPGRFAADRGTASRAGTLSGCARDRSHREQTAWRAATRGRRVSKGTAAAAARCRRRPTSASRSPPA
jgi:hypothetical protein